VKTTLGGLEYSILFPIALDLVAAVPRSRITEAEKRLQTVAHPKRLGKHWAMVYHSHLLAKQFGPM